MLQGLVLERQQFTDKSIIGTIYYNGEEVCKTLELPWRDNERSNSCIPEGIYDLEYHKYRNYLDTRCLVGDTVSHWCGEDRLQRCVILFHTGNTPDDSDGCILTGTSSDTDRVIESKKAHHKLMNIIISKNISMITIV